MGRPLAKSALSHGDRVATVGRLFESTSDASTPGGTTTASNCLGLLCDVRDSRSVGRVFTQALAHFGRVDVIATCSGYGVIGACEDQDEHEVRNHFETNFMGTLHVIQASLPYFRRYIIFTCTSGALGVPGLGPYCATKYAVEGLVESMLYEIKPFGVQATLVGHLVEPGLVRWDGEDGEDDDDVGGGGEEEEYIVVAHSMKQ